MAIDAPELIWHNGELKPWQDANVHVMAHGLHYGSSVFEGIRCYETPDGPAFFRLGDHLKRLANSAKLYRIESPWPMDEIEHACHAVTAANGLDSAYLRPIIYRGYGSLGVAPSADLPVEAAIAAMKWGAYLGEEGLAHGVDVCVSSWQRVAPNTIPAGAKAGGNYLSGQLVSMEAKGLGFHEGIGLGTDGLLSEGGGENLFLVSEGKLYTPPAAASILSGITRDTLITLAEHAGLEVIEQGLPREMLYFCDEAFFTGTAAEVTPIRSVDRRPVGDGTRGPITHMLQDAFFGLFDGRTRDDWGWLEPLRADAAEGVMPQLRLVN